MKLPRLAQSDLQLRHNGGRREAVPRRTLDLKRLSQLEIVLVKGRWCSNFAAGWLVDEWDLTQRSGHNAGFWLSSLVVMAVDSDLSVVVTGV